MPKDYLPLSTIWSCFSRREKKVFSGERNILESENKLDEDDEEMVEDSIVHTGVSTPPIQNHPHT